MRFIGKFISFKNNKCGKEVLICCGLTPVFLLLLLHTIPLQAAVIATKPIAQADTLYNMDTVSIFTEKILFPKSSAVIRPDFMGNNARIDSICSFLSRTDTRNLLSVKVIGSYSPEGKYTFNTNLAEARARALAAFVREIDYEICPVVSIKHPLKGQSVEYRQQRHAELQIAYRNHADAGNAVIADGECRNENGMTADTIITPPLHTLSSDDTIAAAYATDNDCRVTEELPGKTSGHSHGNAFGSRLFVTTNMLYDVALTPNIGVGINVTDRVTLLADWMYARWSNRDKRRYWRIYGGDIEVRYRIGRHLKGSPLGGHHVGAYGSMACYDFQAGRSHSGVLSDKWNYAAGLSYTYSLPVSARLNVDFNLGVGYLWGTYKKHTPIDDCDVWLSTHKFGWFGPTRVGVTLVWLVGNAVTNSRKGGGK